jgi:hypothetical protein
VEETVMERRPIKNADMATAAASNGGDGEVITSASPLPLRVSELEKRISAALADAGAHSTALANLLQQTQWALPEVEQYAAVERDKSLDPTQSPDPRSARAASEDAQLAVGRIQTLQTRLRSRFLQARQQEAVTKYLAKLAELAPQRDALAQELHDTYATATAQLLDVFQRARTFEQQARSALGDPPPNVEVLERIDVRVLDKCTLPDWQRPDINIWPPRSGENFAASFAASMTIPSVGAAWSDPAVQERRRDEQRQEQQRMARHYAQAHREQEERANRQLREEWEARQQQS